MVLSHLKKNIDYPESSNVNADDINHQSNLYKINVLDNIDIIIALGTIKYTFVEQNILYMPIYLVVKRKVVGQLGIFEFLNSMLSSVLDEDDDVNLNEIDPPLLYSFVTKEYLFQKLGKSIREEGEEEGGDDSDDDDDDDSSEGEYVIEILKEKKPEYDDKEPRNWVQAFLKNINYGIIDNEGDGDCLFASIRDAFKGTKTPHSVGKQRAMLATEVTQDLYEGYKTIYNDAVSEIENTTKQLVKIKKNHNEIKKKYKKYEKNDHKKAEYYVKKGAKVKKKFNQLKREKANAEDVVNREFRFMKKVKNINDLKTVIKSCDFWADTWALSTMERVLNIKLIVFSSQHYDNGNMENVLLCGQLNDEQIEKKGVFRPKYYIMVDYTGRHYKLITYKGRKICTFKDLPYSVASLIVAKCMKGMGGLYNLIPAFKKFKKENDPLFNKDIVFQFYSRSQDKKPGEGSGEEIAAAEKVRFIDLKKMKNWRKVLSNFYIDPFTYEGLTWNSVEHLYHALKFLEGNPDFYKKFSLESKSPFSEDPVMAKAAGGKTGVLTKKISGKAKRILLRPKEISADETFWSKKESEMEKALQAKFTQKEIPREVLKNTRDAKLVHYLGRGQGVEVWNHLMRIRKNI